MAGPARGRPFMTSKRDIRQVNAVVRKLRLSKEQRRLLHEELRGQDLTHAEILERARDIRRDYPGKQE